MWRVDSLEKTLMLGGMGAGREGDDRGWYSWMVSTTRWSWVWVNSGSWWWIGRSGVLQFMGSQRVGHDWATEMNWIAVQAYETGVGRPLRIWSGSCLCTTENLNFLWTIPDPRTGPGIFRTSVSCNFMVSRSLLVTMQLFRPQPILT